MGNSDADRDFGLPDLKYDNCGVPSSWADQYNACVPDSYGSQNFPNGTCPNLSNPAPAGYNWSTSNTAERYRRMRDALESVDRTILFSLCDWGVADVNEWGNQTGNSWRMSGDINRTDCRQVMDSCVNTFD